MTHSTHVHMILLAWLDDDPLQYIFISVIQKDN